MIMRGCVSQAGGNLVQLFTILLTMTAFQPYASEGALPIWTFGSVLLGLQVCSIAGSDLSLRAANGLGRVRLLVLAVLAIASVQVLQWVGASRPAVVMFAGAAAVSATVLPVLSAMLNDAIPSR